MTYVVAAPFRTFPLTLQAWEGEHSSPEQEVVAGGVSEMPLGRGQRPGALPRIGLPVPPVHGPSQGVWPFS